MKSSKIAGLMTAISVLLAGNAVGENESFVEGLNTSRVEYGAIRTPFGIFLTRQDGRWGQGSKSHLVQFVKSENGEWQEVRPAFADRQYSESDAYFDHVSGQVCFVSTRPEVQTEAERDNGDIWCVKRDGATWSEPYRLPAPVNSDAEEYSPVFSDSGTLMFASDRAGGLGQGDLYEATLLETGQWTVTNLGPSVNSPYGEWNLGIGPDEQVLIFEASSRPENRTIPGDLYYSKRIDSDWSQAIPLSRLNSDGSDLMPRWFDADTVVYARSNGGDVDLVQVSMDEFVPLPPTVAAVSRSSGEVIFLDPDDLSERRRISVGSGPHEVSMSRDGRTGIVPLFGIYPRPHKEPVQARPPFVSADSQGVVFLDPATGEMEVKPVDKCARPHGVDTDAQARRIWVTCEDTGKIVELDSDGNHIREFMLEKGVHKVLLNGEDNTLLATNPDTGKLSRIDLESGGIESIRTGSGTEGLILAASGETAWITNGGDATLCRIVLPEVKLEWCKSVDGQFPIAFVLDEEKEELWVSVFASAKLEILSAGTGERIGSVDLPTGALDIVSDTAKGILYASLPRHNRVISLDMATRTIIAESGEVMEADDVDLIVPGSKRSPVSP